MTTQNTTMRPINSQEISVSGTTARNSTALKNSDIGFYCATEAYVKFGGSTVEATTTAGSGYDMLVPAATRVDLATGGATHIAVILASGTDTAYINEWSHKAL